MGVISAALKAIGNADPAYEVAELFYCGNKKEVFTNTHLTRALGATSQEYAVNITRRPVDAILDRLKVRSIKVDGEDGATDTGLTEILQEDVYKRNKLKLEIRDALEMASEFGDAYLLVLPAPGEDVEVSMLGGSVPPALAGQEPTKPKTVTVTVTRPSGVDVFIKGPRSSRLFYSPSNRRIKTHYVDTWTEGGYRLVDVYYPDRIERFISRSKESDAQRVGGEWREDQFEPRPVDPEDAESWTDEMEWNELPVFHLRNHRPYGFPEHAQVYGSQMQLNKEIATLMESLDGYAVPFRAALTKSSAVAEGGGLEGDEDGDEEIGEGSEEVSMRPGDMLKLNDVDSLVQLEPGAVSNLLDPIDKTMALASTVSTTPLDYFDPSAASASGESKKEHKAPLLAKVSNRADSYGGTIEDALEFAMLILGHTVSVTVTWQPVDDIDESARWLVVGEKLKAGVPFVQAMIEAGYTKEELIGWVAPEDGMSARVDLLIKVATAAKELGAAVALGALSQEQATEVMSQFLLDVQKTETERDEDEAGDR